MNQTFDFTNDDLWAAVRGLRMNSMTVAELDRLVEQHRRSPLFASRVIAEAARQMRVTYHWRYVEA